MKYLAFIFTIFVLALSVWPCCDDEAQFIDQENHLSTVQEIPCSAENSTHTCSPFFHCSTCQAFALTSSTHLIAKTFRSGKDISYAELPVSPLLLFAGDIWQPPQLV